MKVLPDYSKIGRRSKRRGKTYERRVAALLTQLTGINFRKVPSSGGWNKQGLVVLEQQFSGDVVCDNSNFKFSVEAKNRTNFSLISALSNPDTAPFTEWWYQCCTDANTIGLLPMLIFKPDNQKDFVALSKTTLKELKISPTNIDFLMLNIYRKKVKLRDPHTKKLVKVQLPTPFILDWKKFAEVVDPKLLFEEI